jgi:hypothetical protein
MTEEQMNIFVTEVLALNIQRFFLYYVTAFIAGAIPLINI